MGVAEEAEEVSGPCFRGGMTKGGGDDFGVGGDTGGGVEKGVVGFESALGEVDSCRGVAAAAGVEVAMVEEFGGNAVEVVGGVGSLKVDAEG